MELKPGNDSLNSHRTEELLALLSLASGSEGDADRMCIADGSSIAGTLRHVPSNRLWDILSKIQVKSVLYSPLEPFVPPAAPFTRPPFVRALSQWKTGMMTSPELGDRRNDLAVTSLEHKFSVYGHRVWSPEEEDIVPAPVYCTMVDKTGGFVVTGADDCLLKVWSVSSGSLVATLRGHEAEICDLIFSPCMRYMVSLCSDDFSVIVWRRSGESFTFQQKFVESDHAGRRIKPIFLDFSPNESLPVPPETLKLIVSYTNGLIVVHEVISDSLITEFNRVVPTEKHELKSFAQLPQVNDSLTLLAAVSRGSSAKSIMCYSVRSRGAPKPVEYSFSSAGKSAITHMSVAHHSASFVANDDEISSVVLFKDSVSGEYEKIDLLRGQAAGDAILVNGSSLCARLGVLAGSLRFTVNVTTFTRSDEFVLVAIAGSPRSQTSIGDDDDREVYCTLVFDVMDGGTLVGVLGPFRDHVFSLVLVPVVSAWSYVVLGSYDGSIAAFKLKRGLTGLLSHELSRFNVNADHGSNRPRSVLDCCLVITPEGHTVVAASDARGSLHVFSTDPLTAPKTVLNEQFFHSDYLPSPTPSATTVESGGILCDSRLIPVDQLEQPSLPVCGVVVGSGFGARFNGAVVTVQPYVVGQGVHDSTDEPLVRAPGTVNRRREREERLRSLAQRIGARADEESDEYTRTASGRVVRRMNARHIPEDEFELYENSEIDDSSFSSDEEDADSDSAARRRSQRRTVGPEIDPETGRRRRGRPRLAPAEPEGPTARTSSESTELVPTKLRADQFLERFRNIQLGRRDGHTCTLCGLAEEEASPLLGPFPIADLPNPYFHANCLFSLTGLSVFPIVDTRGGRSGNLTFANLDRLAVQAVRSGKCALPSCRRMGAGTKCCKCRLVFHYPCALISAANAGHLLDPILDPLFVCPRCDAGAEAPGLESFSKRRKWRQDESMRQFLLKSKKSDLFKDTFVPQLGDLVYYYPPRIDWDRPRGSAGSATRTCTEIADGGRNFLAVSDMGVFSWWPDVFAPIPARVESVEYIFPSFFDNEQYAVIQRLTLRTIGGTASGVTSVEGIPFTVHYRPKPNASDLLVPKIRVERALATRFHITARQGTRVSIPIEAGDDEELDEAFLVTAAEGTIAQLRNDDHRSGWECFQIKQVDDDGNSVLSVVSLWELDLTELGATHNNPPTSGVTDTKALFLSEWIDRIAVGSVKNSRNRINIPDGMSIFQFPPWETPGAETYLEIVPYPVWLDLVKMRLVNGFYRSLEEAQKDIRFIASNCAIFNDPASALVDAADNLVKTLLTLSELPESDHLLYAPPTAVTPATSIRLRQPTESESPVRSIRVAGRKSLTCDHCGTERLVDRDVYDDFVATGKRVKCRWLGYMCEERSVSPPAKARREKSQPAPQTSRSGRSVRYREPVSSSDSSESSEDEISDDSSDSSPKRKKRARLR